MPCNKRVSGSGCATIGGLTHYSAIVGASDFCTATHSADMAVARGFAPGDPIANMLLAGCRGCRHSAHKTLRPS